MAVRSDEHHRRRIEPDDGRTVDAQHPQRHPEGARGTDHRSRVGGSRGDQHEAVAEVIEDGAAVGEPASEVQLLDASETLRTATGRRSIS
ncbi:hypothetical protein XF36_25585 [Pseudonocardia sp. HH130629-09]|nr:hypothetical protein XF36_25585 [Pseudonocardia sp. HH130629-09]